MAGRPTKYTGETERKLLDALRNGNTRTTACALAGVTLRTFERWVNDYVVFVDAVQKAEAEAEAERVERIGLAGIGGFVTKRTTVTVQRPDGSVSQTVTEERSKPEWQADAWHLERKNPDAWGRRDRLIIERERLLDETRRKAADQGLDPEAAVAELELLLAEAGGRDNGGRGNRGKRHG